MYSMYCTSTTRGRGRAGQETEVRQTGVSTRRARRISRMAVANSNCNVLLVVLDAIDRPLRPLTRQSSLGRCMQRMFGEGLEGAVL